MWNEPYQNDLDPIKIYIWLDDSTEEENSSFDTFICATKHCNNDSVVNRETFGCGILDSGCSKTVCGVEWLETYLETLSEDELKEVKFEDSDAQFKFGNAQVYRSTGKVIFPAVLGLKKVFIGADVVNTDIPLLLSKTTMKKAKTVIDFENDCDDDVW